MTTGIPIFTSVSLAPQTILKSSVWLFIMSTADAPAISATFALVVKLHLPRCTTTTSPVSFFFDMVQ
uniref:Uncharacterized protein MANES_01G256100 n=1 Tax=Rhizophora mucronata TaxID=61149 RepID=A0A2P2IPQ9_RHIMU